MKEYKIGDQVWVARAGNEKITKTCPICFGKLKVKLTLGDDSEYELPCDYCGKGFDGPTGVVHEYEYRAEPKLYTITKVSVETTEKGIEREYQSDCWVLHEDMVFSTREEALSMCEEIKRGRELEQITRAEYIKKDKNKSYAWNAGYHMREAKRKRKDAEYHEKMAVICKEKAK